MDNSDHLRSLRTNWLYCLLAQVRDDTPEDIQRNVEKSVPICGKHHGIVMDLIASIQFVVFVIHGNSREESRDNCRAATHELLSLLGSGIRMVTFDGNISHGNIGTANRMNYTAPIPNFDRVLAALPKAEYGSIIELGSLP